MNADPLAMEWGPATVELYSPERGLAVHVFNHDLTSEESVRKSIRFAIGRVRWFRLQLPEGARHADRFDDGGQELASTVRESIKSALAPYVVGVTFASERP
jgi:hypothetical protein